MYPDGIFLHDPGIPTGVFLFIKPNSTVFPRVYILLINPINKGILCPDLKLHL